MINQRPILAIYPHVQESKVFDKMPPLGMLWIAAVLQENDYDVSFFDEQLEAFDLEAYSSSGEAPIVLMGGTSHSRFRVFEIATDLKALYPQAVIIYGGPHASFTSEDTLRHNPAIDFIVHGEGEYTCLDLVQWVHDTGDVTALPQIKGISYRNETDAIVTTGWRPFITDLDALPMPARELVPLDKYGTKLEYLELPATSIMTSRGCPVACSFCSASKMFGRSYVTRSATNIVDEIEHLIDVHGIEGYKIFDSTFTLNRKHAESVCDELLRRGITIPWECEVRVGTVTKALLQKMKKAGCYYIDFGAESGDQETLKRMHKGIQLEKTVELFALAKELGLRTKVFFSIGHIEESRKAAKRTVSFIRKHRKSITLVGFNTGLRVYPGTEVAEYAEKNNLLPENFCWSKPYENRANLRLFRPMDNIPLLVQEQLGVEELRVLRIRYILSRVLSFQFIHFKLKLLIGNGELLSFVKLGFIGIFRRFRRKTSEVSKGIPVSISTQLMSYKPVEESSSQRDVEIQSVPL